MVDMPYNPTKPNHIYLIYMYEEDSALNKPRWFICHKTQANLTEYELTDFQDNTIVVIYISLIRTVN